MSMMAMIVNVVIKYSFFLCSLIVLWSSAITMIFSWLYEPMNVWWMALSVLLKDIWLHFSLPPIIVVFTHQLKLASYFLQDSWLILANLFLPVSAGTANNAGAILVLGRDLVVVPKLIHPLPPAISSPEASPERHIEDTWMQVLLHFKVVYLTYFFAD